MTFAGYEELLNEWYWKFTIWRTVFTALTVIAVLSSGIAALRPKSGKLIFNFNSNAWNMLAGAGAICAALIGALNPQDRADRFNAAWIVLNEAVGAHPTDSQELLNAWKHGENIINLEIFKKYLDPGAKQRP
jgi:hypothetical protein